MAWGFVVEPVSFVVQMVAGQASAEVWRRGQRAVSPSDADRVVARVRDRLVEGLPAVPEADVLAGWVVARLAEPSRGNGASFPRIDGGDRSTLVDRVAEQLDAVDVHVFEVPGDWRLGGSELLGRLDLDVGSLAVRVVDAVLAAVRELAAVDGGLPESVRQYDTARMSAQLERIEQHVSDRVSVPRGVVRSQLVGSWWCTGAGLSDARAHFETRGRGQQRQARGGDLFRGRVAALDAIAGWLTASVGPGRAMVVTGRPGAGKSAVVARTVLNLAGKPQERSRVGLAFHARDARREDLGRAVAAVMNVPVDADEAVSEYELLKAARTVLDDEPALLVVDGLDEAVETHQQAIAELLSDLAVLPGWRVVVATRPSAGAEAGANPVGGLVERLGVTAPDASAMVDLDSETYRDPGGLRAFVAALLAQDNVEHPGPPGAAWQRYRDDPALTTRLARLIADRADGNFLVAALAAAPLSERDTMLDPSAPWFDPDEIPTRVGEALEKYIDRLPWQQREVERLLLTALAYARGGGLEDGMWLAFARVLGNTDRIDGLDLQRLRASAAVDYLLHTSHPGGGTVTRLFHQALADQLQTARADVVVDHGSIAGLLLERGAADGWVGYVVDYVAEHAALGGQIDRLLEHAGYLFRVAPPRLLPYLGGARGEQAVLTVMAYRQTAHQLAQLQPATRASLLELAAHRLGHPELAAAIAEAAPERPWETVWSHGQPSTDHVLAEHEATVEALAHGRLRDRTAVVLSSGGRWGVRAWNVDTGEPIGLPMVRFPPMTTMAMAELRDGSTVALGCGSETVVTVWSLETGDRLGSPVALHREMVVHVATNYLRDGTPVGISAGKDGTVRVWNLETGQPIGEPDARHDGRVTALAAATLRNGAPAAVSGGRDGTVRVWNLATGEPNGRPMTVGASTVRDIAATRLRDGTPIVVTGTKKGVQAWNLETRTTIGPQYATSDDPSTTSDDAVRLVAATISTDGGPVVLTEVNGEVLVVSDIETGEVLEEHRVPSDDAGGIRTVAIGRDGTPVVVKGDREGTLWVRRLEADPPKGRMLIGHEAQVTSIRVVDAQDGTQVVVSSCLDDERRQWAAETGTPIGEPVTELPTPSANLPEAFTALPDGTPIVVSGDRQGMIKVRSSRTGSLIHDIDTSGPRTQLSSGEVVLSFDPLLGFAVTRLEDGSVFVISANRTGAHVWQLRTAGEPTGHPLEGAPQPTRAVATTVLPDGSAVVATAGDDGSVHLWDLRTRKARTVPLQLSTDPVTALEFAGDLLVAAAGKNISAHRVRTK